MFLGRDRELAFLDELHASTRPELFVLYGRRRVGKTELLQQFCAKRRAVYFLAAQVREKDNLRAFRDALAAALDEPLAAQVEQRNRRQLALGLMAVQAVMMLYDRHHPEYIRDVLNNRRVSQAAPQTGFSSVVGFAR